MVRFIKAYTILHVFSIALLFMSGCSNPQSKNEAQKLLQSEKEVLESVKSTEQELKQYQPTKDSAYDKVSESKKVVQQDNKKPETSIDSLNRKIERLNQQVADLEKSLEQIKSKLQSLKEKEDITKEAELTEKKEMSEEKDLEGLEKASDKDLVKNEKEPGEKLLERLESEKKTVKNRTDDSTKNDLSEMPDSNLNKSDSVLKSDSNGILKKSGNVKNNDSVEVLIEGKTKINKHSSKGINSKTKIVTIILAVGLVLFIFLYMVGKHGAAKKKSSKKK